MYTHTDKAQFQAEAIRQGKHKLATPHLEILNWITKQFGVTALDFSCETRATSKGQQQLVHVILENADDVKKMQTSRTDQAVIAERFLTYFKSTACNELQDSLKSTVLSFETNPIPEVIVTYRPLKELDGKMLNEMLDDEVRTVLKTFENVWTLSVSVIFYYTDAQVKENGTNGMSAKINGVLEPLSKKYGFAFTPYRFDSKETFDRDYESNWYYYWK